MKATITLTQQDGHISISANVSESGPLLAQLVSLMLLELHEVMGPMVEQVGGTMTVSTGKLQ